MDQPRWKLLDVVSGEFQADLIRSLLEANEVPFLATEEGVGRVLGIIIPLLGEVEFYVPEEYWDIATSILKTSPIEMTSDDHDGDDTSLS